MITKTVTLFDNGQVTLEYDRDGSHRWLRLYSGDWVRVWFWRFSYQRIPREPGLEVRH